MDSFATPAATILLLASGPVMRAAMRSGPRVISS